MHLYIYIYLASMQTTKKGIRIWDVFDVFCTFQSSWRCFFSRIWETPTNHQFNPKFSEKSSSWGLLVLGD
jgi:hypothetical protein